MNMSFYLNPVCPKFISNKQVQKLFHVYLNKFEIAVTHLFLIIFCNNWFT